MPELPEVETLRRELSRALVGKTIKSATVHWPKMIRPLSVPQFLRQIKDRKITSVGRRAKILIFALSGGKCLAIHLKLTGQLIFAPKHGKMIAGGHPEDPARHTRATLTFTDNSKLYFNDLRKFGWLKLVTAAELEPMLNELGVEPLTKEFSFERFQKLVRRYPARKIK